MNDELVSLSADNVETEVKLGAPADLVLPDIAGSLPGLQLDEAPTLVLEAVYHDTDDLALVRNKVSLRHRTGEGAPRWTLKLPKSTDDAVMRRREIEVDSDDGTTVPDVLVGLITAWSRGSAVKPVVTLRTTRRRIALKDRATDEVVGEIDDDSVEVIQDGQLVDQFREIEVEVTASATTDVLPTVTAALRYAGAGEPDPTSKVSRALGARAAVPPGPLAVTIDRQATLRELIRASFTDATLAIIRSDHSIRLDDDPAAIRGASVQARRLRADLRTLRPYVVEGEADRLRDELTWFVNQLGRVRELDVLDRRVRTSTERLPAADQHAGRPILEHIAAVRAVTRTGLVTSMSSTRYVELLTQLLAASADPPVLDGRADERARRLSVKWVRRSVRKLQAEVRQMTDEPSDLELQQLRRRVKRARSVCELVEPMLGSEVRRLADPLADLADVLGDLSDAIASEAWLRSTASLFGDHSISLVAGQLVALQRLDADRLRRSWRRAWKAVDRPQALAALR